MKTLKTVMLSALAVSAASVVVPAPAAEAEAGDWLVRLRGIYIRPNDDAVIDPIGGTSDIGGRFVPELDFTYFLTDKIALELILATAEHNVSAIDTAAGEVDLGDVNLLPPTLTLQYHPFAGEQFSPYFGAGVNYTVFFNEDAPSAAGSAVQDIDYSNEFGLALQAGADLALNDKWFVNVDVKRLWLSTDVTINGGDITADVDIDPWIFGFGIGTRF